MQAKQLEHIYMMKERRRNERVNYSRRFEAGTREMKDSTGLEWWRQQKKCRTIIEYVECVIFCNNLQKKQMKSMEHKSYQCNQWLIVQ